MHQQRKLPSKRYSSYMPLDDFSSLEDHVSAMPDKPRTASENDYRYVDEETNLGNSSQKLLRRKTMNTLHFDALQNAVSKLSRIDDFNMEELGYGFFSDVFKVTHKQSGKIMVLKRNKSTNTKLNILREVQLMNRLAHPNILKFMGVCVHQGQLHALTEFINGGDLDQLVQQKNTYLSWAVRIRLALDVSKGLAYLHSMGIFHRDLTAKNCLVRVTTNLKQKKRYSAVVADLGLAEKIPTKPEEQAKLRVVGTPYCMAPEVLCDKPYDEKSDFFSFGLIICQLIIRTSSDPEKLPRSNDFGLKRDLFNILVKKGVGAPEVAKGMLPVTMPPNGFQQLAYDCCEVDPLKRPGVKEIVCRLEQVSNEEKIQRKAKNDLQLHKEQDTSKRHSIATTVLPSITSLVIDPCNQPVKCSLAEEANGKNENAGKILPCFANSRRLSGSSSRLSRSSSDVSRELISHAASIIASSQKSSTHNANDADDMSSVLNDLNEAFINPFSALEKTELQEPKLFDLPSSEVMEMTFDLPTPKLSSGSPQHSRHVQIRKSRRRQLDSRPKSLLLDSSPLELPLPGSNPLSPRVLTPEPSTDIPHLSHLCGNLSSDSNADTSGGPFSPTPRDEPDGVPPHLRLRQALVRSVAFSPRGRRLLSWWHNHNRSSDWRCMASVLSVMTNKMGRLRKSISVPDLSNDAGSIFVLSHKPPTSGSSSRSSFSSEKESPRSSVSWKPPSGAKLHPQSYPSYITLPRKKKTRRQSTDMHRKHRSKTSDSVFQDANLLDILHEETSNSKQQIDPCTVPLIFSSQHPTSPKGEINNNTATAELKPSMAGARNEPCVCQDKLTPISSPSDARGGGLLDDVAAGPEDVLSSSNPSGMSSTGLQMSLNSGAVSSNRRKRGDDHPTFFKQSVSSTETLSLSSELSHHSGDHKSLLYKDATFEHQGPPSTCNRDSGYNDDVFSTDHSCDSQSSHDNDTGDTVTHYTAPTNPTLVHGLPEYLGQITPTCKIKESTDSGVKLIGRSH